MNGHPVGRAERSKRRQPLCRLVRDRSDTQATFLEDPILFSYHNCYGMLLITRSHLLLSSSSSLTPKMFKTVCLGGTFDGIHKGHKRLFEEATKICEQRLIVGVTDGNMIKSKLLWELIAPVDERINNLRGFLRNLNANLTCDIVPIHDLYGPTIDERDIDCIVVSEETIRGAHKINEARKAKNWPELKFHVTKLVQYTDSANNSVGELLKENKISSSHNRIQRLGTILKPPVLNDSIPSRPYLIGLTGGIASGKSTISEYLKTLGFGCINYDLMGHRTYERIGSPVYKQIVENFGSDVLNQVDNHIDRKRLGKLVFGDKTKLNKLNEIVWPAIYKLVDEEIDRLKDKHEVLILESALFVESKQTNRVHQVWTTIVPPEEAITRQVQSRNLSYDEAESRVKAQLDNLTRVRHSNVVFCTLWDLEFTKQQVRKCVKQLKEEYLSK